MYGYFFQGTELLLYFLSNNKNIFFNTEKKCYNLNFVDQLQLSGFDLEPTMFRVLQ